MQTRIQSLIEQHLEEGHLLNPILFKGEMVRANNKGNKTETRRIVRPQPIMCYGGKNVVSVSKLGRHDGYAILEDAAGNITGSPYGGEGDLLWVRENFRIGAWNWKKQSVAVDYQADGYCREEWLHVPDREMFERFATQSLTEAEKNFDGASDGGYTWKPGESPCRWRPSIHMPLCLTRTLLRVLEVRVERIQDIDYEGMMSEGLEVRTILGAELRGRWIHLWDSINGERRIDGKRVNWKANPWVWVVRYEVIT